MRLDILLGQLQELCALSVEWLQQNDYQAFRLQRINGTKANTASISFHWFDYQQFALFK